MPGTPVVIEVRVAELRQLFNAMDPAPFRERDLDPRAEEFIVEWAREAPRDAPLSLLVVVDQRPEGDDRTPLLTDAVHQFFAQRALASRRRLKRLFHTGRISLAIGVALLAALIGVGELLGRWVGSGRFADILHESLLIGGWVAMWRPLEIFLYDWWPIHGEARLYDRLAVIPVSIRDPQGQTILPPRPIPGAVMTEPRESTGQYPVNHVVGVIDTPADAKAAAEALASGGFLPSEIHVACGSAAAESLRATTGRTGIVNAAIRIAQRLGVANHEMEVKATYEKALADGRFVLIVDAPTDTRRELARSMLRDHKAHAVAFLGRYSIEKLIPPNRD